MDQTFETSAFYLAAYLCAHECELTGYDRDHFNRVVFQFQDTNDVIRLVNEFTLGREAVVDANRFINGIKRLKRIIHDG